MCKFHVDISICVHVMSVFSFWLNFEQLEKSGIPNPIFSKIWHNFIFDAIHHVYQFHCRCSIFLDSRGSSSFWPKVKRHKKTGIPDPKFLKNLHNLPFHAIKLVCKFHVDSSIFVNVISFFSFWPVWAHSAYVRNTWSVSQNCDFIVVGLLC